MARLTEPLRRPRPAWCLALLLALPGAASAHRASDSYLTLDLAAVGAPHGRWDIAVRDLDRAIGLDADGDGAITWGELRARHAAVAAYALGRLEVLRGGQRCATRPVRQLVDDHADGVYAVLEFALECRAAGSALSVDYRLLFDVDALHRGLLQVREPGGAHTAVLSPDAPRRSFVLGAPEPARTFGGYWREGVWHIWHGFDHLIFLVTLLLPAVLRRRDGGWHAADTWPPVAIDVLAVVTAFTVAHSITLSLAVLDRVSLPTRPVETAIAATVVLGALNNLWPLVERRRWAAAFALGLVHGFGFAAVLVDLGLPTRDLGLALAGFNLGVECGQLAVVAALVPLAYVARGSSLYRRAVLPAGSLAVAVIGLFWLLERSGALPA